MTEELELKVTVKGHPNLGEKIRQLVVDGEQGEGVMLASDGYTVDIVKLERADGLPLSIEEDFSDWFSQQKLQVSYRDIARLAYFAGRAAK